MGLAWYLAHNCLKEGGTEEGREGGREGGKATSLGPGTGLLPPGAKSPPRSWIWLQPANWSPNFCPCTLWSIFSGHPDDSRWNRSQTPTPLLEPQQPHLTGSASWSPSWPLRPHLTSPHLLSALPSHPLPSLSLLAILFSSNPALVSWPAPSPSSKI